MSPLTRIVTLLIALSMSGCDHQEPRAYQGYVEGEYLYLAAPKAGYLKALDTPRGSRVVTGQEVFAVAADPDVQSLTEAEARADAARQKLENLKAPRRPPEIAALRANLRSAEAGVELARVQLRRQEELAQKKFVAQVKVDEARSAYEQAVGDVEALRQQITGSQSTVGRQAEIRGAQADLAAANATAAQRRWVVSRKTVMSPATGEIVETYYRPGEWVPTGSPVASLLPDNRRRLRFFVPETVVAGIKPGSKVVASCDGCAHPVQATVDFVSPAAEYTPPMIYSHGSREKLVFRIDALPTPDQAALLRPGLPMDIHLVK